MTRNDLVNCIAACNWALEDIEVIACRTGLDTTQQRAAFSLTAANCQRAIQQIDEAAAKAKNQAPAATAPPVEKKPAETKPKRKSG